LLLLLLLFELALAIGLILLNIGLGEGNGSWRTSKHGGERDSRLGSWLVGSVKFAKMRPSNCRQQGVTDGCGYCRDDDRARETGRAKECGVLPKKTES